MFSYEPRREKPAFCICENKDADQLRCNREADQRLCFCIMVRTISLLPRYEISSLQPSSVAVQPGLCGTWSETPKTGFLRTRLISFSDNYIASTHDPETCMNSWFRTQTDLLKEYVKDNNYARFHMPGNHCCNKPHLISFRRKF